MNKIVDLGIHVKTASSLISVSAVRIMQDTNLLKGAITCLPTVCTEICICAMQMNMLSFKMFLAERLEIKHAGRLSGIYGYGFNINWS